MPRKRAEPRAELRIVRGGRRLSATCAGIRVVAAGADDPPFPVDAVALEEDTWTVLSTRADRLVSTEHPVRVMTRAWEARPRKTGTVVVKPGRPARLLAVVHDLDQEPSWTEGWIEQALAAVLRAAAERGYESLELPLLGTRHGNLPPRRFVEMLGRTLPRALTESQGPPLLRRIWLKREGEPDPQLLDALAPPS